MADGNRVSTRVPFCDLVTLLEKLNKQRGTEKKKQILKSFVDHWRATTTDSFYPALRLLLPQHDKDRQPYGMKEVILAKQYIDILGIAKDSAEAKKLVQYKAPTAAGQDAGDFASVAFFVLKNRCPEKGSLSIEEVNEQLDAVAQGNAEKERNAIKKALQVLLRNTSALEQKWLIRIILKELKVGLSENSVFAVYHPDAMDLYNVSNSLSKVCLMLKDPTIRMNEADISVFTPFRPMLGQRAAIDKVDKLMDNKPFYIETKVDGERMLIHKEGDKFKYYTRNANEYTTIFGSDSRMGTLTPFITGCFLSNIHSCILDGEMVVFDQDLDSALTKANNVDVKLATTCDSNGMHPCFIAFDVLLINERKLSNVPLRERIIRLNDVFTSKPSRMEFVKRQDGCSRDDVVKALNQAIDDREEGLVIKDPESIYKPSVRNGSGWLKIKPEYVDSLSEELDLIILGGNFGSGHRGGIISQFILGVAVLPEDPTQHPTEFHSLCKVGSGYTMKELKDLGEQLHPHWTKKQPKGVFLASGLKEKPDVWIEPAKSKIVQIKATEIVPSQRFKAGMTLRFPRLEKVRDDKDWFECLNLSELTKLNDMAKGKLSHQHLSTDMPTKSSKKRQRRSGVERPVTVAKHLRSADFSKLQQKSKIFQGKEFCIINGPAATPKNELEKKIRENGGDVVQNAGAGTFCIVVDKKNVRVQNIIKKGEVDVVKASWLINCLDQNNLLPWQPKDMLHTSPETNARFKDEFDEFGDSFSEDCTEQSLRDVFNKIKKDERLAIDKLEETQERYFTNDVPLRLFRKLRFYLDRYSVIGDVSMRIINSSLELVELELRFHGGFICEHFDNDVTHIIVDSSDTSRLQSLQQLIHVKEKKQHIVTSDWVSACLKQQSIISERSFGVR